jgi:hypothetical protein
MLMTNGNAVRSDYAVDATGSCIQLGLLIGCRNLHMTLLLLYLSHVLGKALLVCLEYSCQYSRQSGLKPKIGEGWRGRQRELTMPAYLPS